MVKVMIETYREYGGTITIHVIIKMWKLKLREHKLFYQSHSYQVEELGLEPRPVLTAFPQAVLWEEMSQAQCSRVCLKTEDGEAILGGEVAASTKAQMGKAGRGP